MLEFRDRAGQLVRTAQQIASLRGAVQEAAVLAQSSATLIETGYDNWNNGITFYTLTIEVPISVYAELDETRTSIEKSIHRRVSELTRTEAGVSITEVVISPELADDVSSNDETSGEQAEAPPLFWAPGHFRLFITHVSAMKNAAHSVKVALAPYQIAGFVAHDDIEPTKEWQAEIESALRTMDTLIAIITPEFMESKWCNQEVGIAIGRGKLVVPIRVGADPHGFLGKYQALTIEKSATVNDIAREIFDIVVKHHQSYARMADALVERLAQSSSFDMAKRTMTLIEQVPNMNHDQVARLVRTIDENLQVEKAFGVPERIKSIIGRLGQPDAS
ncbi:MAG: hypothetical protein A2X49_14285 [Lentisphaerae bacterium GWF2_52_8]|nr:MAG: hypothetical protein A2X49_14285 [Lentisphaerae bacterium GWF2_52_8]